MSFPIKAEITACSNYKKCLEHGMSEIEIIENIGLGCCNCNLYKAYLFGFSEGAKQTVKAINEAKPLLKPFSRGYEGGRQ